MILKEKFIQIMRQNFACAYRNLYEMIKRYDLDKELKINSKVIEDLILGKSNKFLNIMGKEFDKYDSSR